MKPYKFFNGEASNPFAATEHDAARMFWSYERMFVDTFAQGDFNTDIWFKPTMSAETKNELSDALATKDKDDIFKIWLYSLLFEYLPDKHECEPNYFNNLYWANTSSSTS